MDIHAPGGIGTHNPSKRKAVYPHLRPPDTGIGGKLLLIYVTFSEAM
jgi:hypothetical protein